MPTCSRHSKAPLNKAGATFEIVAPTIAGVQASDGSWIDADQMIDGGPSVLYDAVAILPAAAAMSDLLLESAARDFLADAFAHCKFIGFTSGAIPLLAKAGVDPAADEGLIALGDSKSIDGFITSCRKLRLWARESSVKL